MHENFMERQVGKQLQYHVLKNVTEVCMIAMRPQREYFGLPGRVREDFVMEAMVSQRSKGQVIKKECNADITA